MVFNLGWSMQAKPPVAPRAKPKVAVALSAGAARGWAQIGVFRELLSNGLAPDIVVGTSIGAVVGGCYAAGRLDQIESFACSLSKRRVFGLMDVSLSGMGILAGARLRARLETELGPLRIEDLPIGFGAVATEVHTEHEIWLLRGGLVDAIRASYALPGLFEPVHLDGRWLMDSALVNPIPISVCRALGADIVVAVNLIAETLGRAPDPGNGIAVPPFPAAPRPGRPGRLQSWFSSAPSQARPLGPGIASVLVDAFNITQDRIARSRLAGDPPDVTINVKCGRIGLFDFHRADELIAIGREATQKAMPDLRDYIGVYPGAVSGEGGV